MYPEINGFNVKEITLYNSGNIAVGNVVMLGENHTALVPSAGSAFIGVCTQVRGDYVSVAVTGAVTFPYSGSKPVVGYNLFSADGNGAVKINTGDGKDYLVTDVDEAEGTMTIML